MNDLINDLQKRASAKKKTIILPESNDDRVLSAAAELTRKKIARIILVGDPLIIKERSKVLAINLENTEIINPLDYQQYSQLVVALVKRRQHRGMTVHDAEKIFRTDNLFIAAMMVGTGAADGMVAGASCPTKHTIQAALHCIGIKSRQTILSSFFIMIMPEIKFNRDGVFVFADCAVNVDPNELQLAEIAVSTVQSTKTILQRRNPKVAMLSYSTLGSAKGDIVKKIHTSITHAKAALPDICIDGELQFDAAIMPKVAELKAPKSAVAGSADILIFPDLNAGNIGYKIAQRLGNLQAIGPVFQGLNKPVNDLSRGCNIDDIVNVAAITALQSE